MESQPQNPEFRNNPENFHPCKYGTPFVHSKGQNFLNYMYYLHYYVFLSLKVALILQKQYRS